MKKIHRRNRPVNIAVADKHSVDRIARLSSICLGDPAFHTILCRACAGNERPGEKDEQQSKQQAETYCSHQLADTRIKALQSIHKSDLLKTHRK